MIVLDHEAVRDVEVKRDFDLVLGVQAQPLPTVDAGAAEVARGVREAGVLDGDAAIAPVGQARGELVGALVAGLDGGATALAAVGARLARGHDALAARVAVGVVPVAHGHPLARGALAARAGDVEHFGVNVNHWLGRVDAAAAVLHPNLGVDGVARLAADGRRVELVVARANGFGEGLLVLARVVVEAVETHCGARMECRGA